MRVRFTPSARRRFLDVVASLLEPDEEAELDLSSQWITGFLHGLPMSGRPDRDTQ